MRGTSIVFVLLCLALPVSLPVSAHAEDAVSQARSIITKQISAFIRQDAEAAYSLASPEIKSRFRDPETFSTMVKNTYAAVYHPDNYAFGRTKASDDGKRVFQEVLISDAKGVSWAAFYDLIRETDGPFMVNGVRMTRDTVNQGL